MQKERPILFNAEMVRALLEGRKTQTRRVVKPQPDLRNWIKVRRGKERFGNHICDSKSLVMCPYGQAGDRLWVRETWADLSNAGFSIGEKETPAAYRASTCAEGDRIREDYGIKWKPSIHMPRWASRINLEIKAIRVERLQDISEVDAIAEGITDGGCTNCGEHEPCGCDAPMPDYIDAFACLWHSIHGTESWHSNPWVWVIEFERIE